MEEMTVRSSIVFDISHILIGVIIVDENTPERGYRIKPAYAVASLLVVLIVLSGVVFLQRMDEEGSAAIFDFYIQTANIEFCEFCGMPPESEWTVTDGMVLQLYQSKQPVETAGLTVIKQNRTDFFMQFANDLVWERYEGGEWVELEQREMRATYETLYSRSMGTFFASTESLVEPLIEGRYRVLHRGNVRVGNAVQQRIVNEVQPFSMEFVVCRNAFAEPEYAVLNWRFTQWYTVGGFVRAVRSGLPMRGSEARCNCCFVVPYSAWMVEDGLVVWLWEDRPSVGIDMLIVGVENRTGAEVVLGDELVWERYENGVWQRLVFAEIPYDAEEITQIGVGEGFTVFSATQLAEPLGVGLHRVFWQDGVQIIGTDGVDRVEDVVLEFYKCRGY